MSNTAPRLTLGLPVYNGERFLAQSLDALLAQTYTEFELIISDNEEAWDVLEDIPNDSAAALILLEHQWAVPLRDAVMRAGGFRISDGFISPLDLVAIGLASADEASQHHEMETKHAVAAPA